MSDVARHGGAKLNAKPNSQLLADRIPVATPLLYAVPCLAAASRAAALLCAMHATCSVPAAAPPLFLAPLRCRRCVRLAALHALCWSRDASELFLTPV